MIMEQDLMFSGGTFAGYVLTGVMYFVLPAAVFFCLRRYRAIRLIPLAAGMIVYLLSPRFCDIFTGMLLRRQTIAIQTAAAACFVGLFEEPGRFLAMKTPLAGIQSTAAALSYGLGHAGMECMIRGVRQFRILNIGQRLNVNGISVFLSDKTTERAAEITAQIQGYADKTLVLSVLDALNTVTNVGVHLALTLLIYKKLREGLHPVRWLGLACMLHVSLNDCGISMSILGGMYFSGIMTVFWGIGIIVLVWKLISGSTVLDEIRYQMADSEGYVSY